MTGMWGLQILTSWGKMIEEKWEEGCVVTKRTQDQDDLVETLRNGNSIQLYPML